MVNVSVSIHDIDEATQAVHDATLLSMGSSYEAVRAVMNTWSIRFDHTIMGDLYTKENEKG